MQMLSLTDFKGNIVKHFDKMEHDRHEIIVTRHNHEPCVVMPLAEYEGLKETLHLLSSAANAKRLFESIEQLHQGHVEEKQIA